MSKTKSKIPTPRTKRLPKENPIIKGVNSPTSAKKVLALTREHDALMMRLTGATFEQIAATLGCAEETARQAVIRAIEKLKEETKAGAEYLRELERQRLERLILAAMPRATSGDVEAINSARMLSESIRKLLGIDLAATRVSLIDPLTLHQAVIDQFTTVYGPENPPS